MNSKIKNLIKVSVCFMILWAYLTNNKPVVMQTDSFETVEISALQTPITDGLKTKLFTIRDKQLKTTQPN